MSANPNSTPNANPGAGGAQPIAEDQPAPEPRDPRFFWLTVFQYVLISLVTLTFVFVLAYGAFTVKDIGNVDVARGLITYVIAVGTIAIAIMLAISAIVTREFNTRIAVGKEILALLIGVLGTIVGFYYGASTKPEAGANKQATQTQAAQISSEPVTITPAQVTTGGTATLSTKLTGGTPPYSYSIKFEPNTIPAIENQESADGVISKAVIAAVPAGTDIVFRIEGKDKNGVAFEINKDGKQKIPVR
jgi:hypothetical protein